MIPAENLLCQHSKRMIAVLRGTLMPADNAIRRAEQEHRLVGFVCHFGKGMIILDPGQTVRILHAGQGRFLPGYVPGVGHCDGICVLRVPYRRAIPEPGQLRQYVSGGAHSTGRWIEGRRGSEPLRDRGPGHSPIPQGVPHALQTESRKAVRKERKNDAVRRDQGGPVECTKIRRKVDQHHIRPEVFRLMPDHAIHGIHLAECTLVPWLENATMPSVR